MIEKKLSEFAKEKGLTYKNAWNMARAGTLGAKTTTNANGRISVLLEEKPQVVVKEKRTANFAEPSLAGKNLMEASTRRNAAATSNPTNMYFHINNGITPASAFNRRGDGGNHSNSSVTEAIQLCQKAYFNFSIFRNTIDAMTEFSVSKIYYQGGTSKSRNFFENLFESLNIYAFQDMFFREYYRSGNVFIYRFEVSAKEEDISRLNKVYGSTAAKLQLPSRYSIINPYDVGAQSNIVFGTSTVFFKRLNGYEIHRLKNPETEEEKNFFNSLPDVTQKQIKAGSGTVIIPLEGERLYAAFYKKQEYEALAVPMGYPVLKDIEWKAEMKHIDMAVSRTMNNVVLLVKMGYESKDGDYMFDPKAAAAMQSLFESESVGKTLVADFTTEVSFVIPAIGDFLDPEKYQIVNEDIKTGLNYVLTGTDSKFANQFISVQLFVQRLQQAREIFINQFLMPEIKRISNLMGFKSYPTPKFEDIDLKNDIEFNKIATQMASLGILTAPELLESIETGRIPTKEESLEHQEEFRQLKDKGFYEPLIGSPYSQMKIQKQVAQMKINNPTGNSGGVGPQKQTSAPTGRPSGVNTPQSTKKVSITKGSQEEVKEMYSLSKIKENLIKASNLRDSIKDYFIKSKKIKKLNDEQLDIINSISEIIIADNTPDKWEDKKLIESYIKNPISNGENNKKIDEIAYNHQIEPSLAAILLNSPIKEKDKEKLLNE